MVTGSAASIVYGEPRLTHGIDLVVEMQQQEAPKIVDLFPADEFYCPPLESLKEEAERPLKGHFNIIHHASGFKADIYLMGEDKLHTWAMSARKRIEMEGFSIWVAPAEYVILRKLEYYKEGGSEKHIRDIEGMISLSLENIDLSLLQKKIKELTLTKEWEKIQMHK